MYLVLEDTLLTSMGMFGVQLVPSIQVASHLVTNRHIVSFKRHFGNNKQAHCMHIVRVTSRHIG